MRYLLQSFNCSKWDHLTDISQINDVHIFGLIFCHMFRVLRICLHRLIENLLDVCVFEVGLILVCFHWESHLARSQNVDEVSLLALLVKFASPLFHCIGDNFYHPIQLPVCQFTEDGNCPEVHLHLWQLALFLQEEEIVVLLRLQVEEVTVLHRPHGSVASSLSRIAQVSYFFTFGAKTELAEVRTLIEFSEYDFLWLVLFV